MDNETDGRIVGKPTLLVTYSSKLDPQAILAAIGGAGYPLDDVSVYYRVEGTDQVIDATTGQVAAGQALSAEKLGGKELEKLDTLVLLHPDGAQFVAIQGALKPLGEADIKYAEQSVVGGNSDGEVIEPETPQAG
jgi:large exoprotein involved in heme utilization and adhesion